MFHGILIRSCYRRETKHNRGTRLDLVRAGPRLARAFRNIRKLVGHPFYFAGRRNRPPRCSDIKLRKQ